MLTGLGSEALYVDPLIEHYSSRISNARAFALAHRVVLVETATGVPLDISPHECLKRHHPGATWHRKRSTKSVRRVFVKCGRTRLLQAVPRTANHAGLPMTAAPSRS